MDEDGIHRKLTAILSADVAGYSRLMRDDEMATFKALTSCRETMFDLIRQHKGRVVDAVGDNLLAEFSSVVDGIQSAIAIQKELAIINAEFPDHRRMDFRIGINVGDVIQEGERIYGDGVNIAARLEKLADPGGICISRTAYDQIESKLPVGYEYLGEKTVKNINKPLYAYRVIIDPGDQDRLREEAVHFSSEEGAGQGGGSGSGPGDDQGGADNGGFGTRHGDGHAHGHGDREAEDDHFRRIKHQVHDFAKDISQDEHIRETLRETKDRVKDFTEKVSGDSDGRKRVIRRFWDYKQFKLFVVMALFLIAINALTSWGNWWFRFPVLGLGLAFFIQWLMSTMFSAQRVEELENRLLNEELSKHPQEPSRAEREEIKKSIKDRIGFYRHLYTYIGVICLLFLINMLTNPFTLWFIFPALGWGIGIFFHWFNLKKPEGK